MHNSNELHVLLNAAKDSNNRLALISGTGKATDFKFGGYIYRANPSKSPFKV